MYRLTSNYCKKHKASVFKEARQWSVVCATQPEVNNNYDIKQNFTQILGNICVTIRSFWWRILVASISDSYYHNGTKAKPCNCVFCGVGLRKFMKAFDVHRSYFHVWVFTNLSYLNLICNQIFLRCFDIHIFQHLIEVFQNWLF